MSSIPLPALGLKAPEQPDLLQKAGQLAALRHAAQQQQLGQQQIQGAQLDNQMRELELRDQQTSMQVLGKYNGDLDAALPELSRSVSARTFIGLQKSASELKEKATKLKGDELDNKLKTDNMMLGLIGEAAKVPPEQWAQAYPQVAAKALEIDPSLKGHIDPNQPMPQEALQQFGLLYQTQTSALAKESAQRQAQQEQETVRHNKEMEQGNVTEAKLAFRAAQGDATAQAALKRLDESKRASRPVNNIMTNNDAKDIADAIENGDQPPTLQGLYRNAGPVRAELARRGVPLAHMETDWKATQKYISTLNGPQQTRLRQAISTASDSLDKIDDLYKQYHDVVGDAGMKVFNKAGLAAAKQLPGKAGALATALDAQIADLTSELGNVYMGGNSPTDHSLGLAAKNLSSDWNRETFEEGLKQARANIKIRQNSITHAQPAGLSGETNYFQNQQQAAPAPAAGGVIYARDPQGKLHSAPAGTALPAGWTQEKR